MDNFEITFFETRQHPYSMTFYEIAIAKMKIEAIDLDAADFVAESIAKTMSCTFEVELVI